MDCNIDKTCSRQYVVGISGASGIILGFKVTRALTHLLNTVVHLVITPDARYTAFEELGKPFPNNESIYQELGGNTVDEKKVIIHSIHDFSAPIASGTFITQGMVIVPCSMATLAAVSIGLSDTLLRRAADVTLKERRRLIIVPREAPFSSIHLQHMLSLSNNGAVIISPQPAWYTHQKTIQDVEDHIVGRILDSLGVHIEYTRWSGSTVR